jgi:hypothetical protein
MGVASYLLEVLERIAIENKYSGFSATVLRQNTAMLRVFKKRFPNAKLSTQSGSDVRIQMEFADRIGKT